MESDVADFRCRTRGRINFVQIAWKDLIKQAWLDRVGLSVTGFYMTPDIKYDFQTLQGKAFYYFCYGAAVTEVEIDTRTGEYRKRV